MVSSINQQTTNVGEDVEKTEPHALLVGMQINAATVESTMELLKKLKMELPYDPLISCMGIANLKECTPIFTAAFFTLAKLWKQP